MKWVFELTLTAQEDLRDLPDKIRKRVGRTIEQMENDPFQGDVKALKGRDFKRLFRRRIGDYRIIFSADQRTGAATVFRILPRSEKTYKDG